MLEDTVIVIITLASKQNEKRILTGIASHQSKPTTDRFNDMIKGVIHDIIGLIKCIDFVVDLITVPHTEPLNYEEIITAKIRTILSEALQA